MILTTTYHVDISRPLLPVPLQQMLITKDKGANRIAVELFNGPAPFSPGGSCAGFAVRRDGQTVPIEGGVVSGNRMYIDLPEAAYALEGPINIGIKNVNTAAGTETTVFLGLGVVSLGETDTVIDPGAIIPSVSALISAIETAVATIPASYSTLLNAIAPTFDNATDYSAGDYAWYDGALYHFTEDHPAGSWTGEDAETAVFAEDVAALHHEIDVLSGALTQPVAVDFSSVIVRERNISSGNVWVHNTGNNGYFLTVPADASKLTVTASENNGSVVALLKTNSAEVGDTPDYATGGSRVTISAGTTKEFILPEDCHYVYILKTLNSTDYTPASATFDANRTVVFSESIAPDYADLTFPVSKGQPCWHGGVLYRAKDDIATSETWTAAHWETAQVATDMETMRREMQEQINVIDGILSYEAEANFSTATVKKYLISSSTGKWAYDETYGTYFVELPTGTKRVSVTANNSVAAIIALLKTSTSVSGTTPDYATGCGREAVAAGTTVEYDVPDDARYIAVMKTYSGTDYTPSALTFKVYREIPDVDPTLTISGDAADAKATGDKLAEYDAILYTNEAVDFSTAPTRGYIIGATHGTWSSASGNASYFIPVTENLLRVTVTANAEQPAIVALLKTANTANNVTPDYATGGSRVTIQAGESQTFTFPTDCHYLCIMKAAGGNDYTPASTIFKSVAIPSEDVNTIPLGLHTMPSNQGALNVVKRCRQLTDIEWTPAVDLPRYMYATPTPPSDSAYNTNDVLHYKGVFKAGQKYKGIPYGRSDFLDTSPNDYGYVRASAGFDIGLETFVTAVQNPESIISKQNFSSVASHRSIPYAIVCSIFTCYALGLSTYYTTENIHNIPGLNVVDSNNPTIAEIDLNKIAVADVLNYYAGDQSGHTIIISDVVHDDGGNVTFVELSEATTTGEADPDYAGGEVGGLCRRVGFSADDFRTRYGIYTLYRYAYVSGVPYTPSPYVNVGDELNMFCLRRLPCMPYMGEGFKYKSGKIPNSTVVITTDNYSYLRVFKDGEELSASPFAVANDAKYVDVGFADTGDYVAYLCNMDDGVNTSVTAKCHWSVVE